MSEAKIDYGQTATTEMLDRATQPKDGDLRIEFMPEKMNVWREIKLRNGKAQVDVPQKLQACQSKLANAIFNLWVSERFIEKITAKLGKTKTDLDEFDKLLEELLNEKIQAVQECEQLRKQNAQLLQENQTLSITNNELKQYIKERSK